MIEIIVYGHPAPQGSKAFKGIHGGHAVLVESSKAVKPWRMDVKHAAIEAHGGNPPMDGPLCVRMVFTLRRPRGHYGTGRNEGKLKPYAPTRPAGLPDLSKLLRSTEDALTQAGVWVDDSRVVEYERAAKVFAGEDPEALHIPGARITIYRRDER